MTYKTYQKKLIMPVKLYYVKTDIHYYFTTNINMDDLSSYKHGHNLIIQIKRIIATV